MGNLAAYLDIARTPFALLPVTLVASGSAAGAYEGAFGWLQTGMSLVGLLALHAAVNSLNEASDIRTGIDLLARINLGEIVAGFGFSALPVAGTTMVQNGTIGTTAVEASLLAHLHPIGFGRCRLSEPHLARCNPPLYGAC